MDFTIARSRKIGGRGVALVFHGLEGKWERFKPKRGTDAQSRGLTRRGNTRGGCKEVNFDAKGKG